MRDVFPWILGLAALVLLWTGWGMIDMGTDDQLEQLVQRGLSPEELSIESQGQSLKFSGKRGSEGESGTVHRNERWRGEFGRSVELPRELNPSKASADYKNGVLSVHVPLRDEAKPQKITVRAS